MNVKKDKEIKEILKSEFEYRLEDTSDKQKKIEENNLDNIPIYRTKLDLTDEQIDSLTKQVKDEFMVLKDERKSLKLDEEWSIIDKQYDGILRQNKKLNFNLHSHQSKIKSDAIVRALNEAFLDSEPMVDVSPRPGFFKTKNEKGIDGDDISDKQTQFIDFAFDEEIQPQKEITLINRSAVNKFVGIGKIEWAYEKDRRKRFEKYEGKNEIVDIGGESVLENKALKEFIKNYPDAEERYPGYVKRLSQGGKISIVVDYFDVINNCPKIKHVPVENFYVRNCTNYYDGLKNAHLVAERFKMTWWELKKKEKNGEFENIEDIKNLSFYNDDKNIFSQEKFEHRVFPIIEATTYFLIKNSDDEETKIKCWFLECGDELHFLGAILYPWFGYDIDYIPFYVKLNEDGFYGGAKSVMRDLRDSTIAQDALLNLYLHSIYIRNVLTPIVKEGSEIETVFSENRWMDGKPISVDQTVDDVNKAFSFVEYPNINLSDMQVINAFLKKIDSDVSGVSDLMTGRENPNDPRAPATKTIALLNQSGVNIKDFIRIYLPSFNVLVSCILQLYYQMSQEGRKYRVGSKSKSVTGVDSFAEIRRDEMIAKTNIQARAASFAFDKINEKNENMAMMQTLLMHPYASQLPELQYEALKQFMKSWSDMWKNIADNKLPSPDEFKKTQQVVAINALKTIMDNMAQQAQVSGVAPGNMSVEQLGNTVTKAQAINFNPALGQEQKR